MLFCICSSSIFDNTLNVTEIQICLVDNKINEQTKLHLEFTLGKQLLLTSRLDRFFAFIQPLRKQKFFSVENNHRQVFEMIIQNHCLKYYDRMYRVSLKKETLHI